MELDIQGFGARLRVKDGLFEVTVPDLTGGNREIVDQFAAHQIKTIVLHTSTSISTDAVLLAMREGVDIIFTDHHGNPEGRLYPNRPNATIDLWKAQLHLSDTDEGLQIARLWIVKKIQSRLEHLAKLKPYRSVEKKQLIEKAELAIKPLLQKIKEHATNKPVENAASLRGLEGTAGRYYFETISALLPDEYQYGGRSFRPADDIFNAYLNYGYGILYRKVENALHIVGLNPYIGLMHIDGHKRKSLVFDFIEAFRAWIEVEVLKLFTSKKAQPRHGNEHKDKGLLLNTEGKNIVATAVLTRFKEHFEDISGKVYTFETLLLENSRYLMDRILRGYQKTSYNGQLAADN
jgi:CRISP-associated protein Cas1